MSKAFNELIEIQTELRIEKHSRYDDMYNALFELEGEIETTKTQLHKAINLLEKSFEYIKQNKGQNKLTAQIVTFLREVKDND